MAAGMCGKGFLGSGVVTTSIPARSNRGEALSFSNTRVLRNCWAERVCVRRVWDICGVRHWEHPEDYWGTPHGPAFPVHSPGAGRCERSALGGQCIGACGGRQHWCSYVNAGEPPLFMFSG